MLSPPSTIPWYPWRKKEKKKGFRKFTSKDKYTLRVEWGKSQWNISPFNKTVRLLTKFIAVHPHSVSSDVVWQHTHNAALPGEEGHTRHRLRPEVSYATACKASTYTHVLTSLPCFHFLSHVIHLLQAKGPFLHLNTKGWDKTIQSGLLKMPRRKFCCFFYPLAVTHARLIGDSKVVVSVCHLGGRVGGFIVAASSRFLHDPPFKNDFSQFKCTQFLDQLFMFKSKWFLWMYSTECTKTMEGKEHYLWRKADWFF